MNTNSSLWRYYKTASSVENIAYSSTGRHCLQPSSAVELRTLRSNVTSAIVPTFDSSDRDWDGKYNTTLLVLYRNITSVAQHILTLSKVTLDRVLRLQVLAKQCTNRSKMFFYWVMIHGDTSLGVV